MFQEPEYPEIFQSDKILIIYRSVVSTLDHYSSSILKPFNSQASNVRPRGDDSSNSHQSRPDVCGQLVIIYPDQFIFSNSNIRHMTWFCPFWASQKFFTHLLHIDFHRHPPEIQCISQWISQPPQRRTHRAKRLRDGTVRHQGLERLPAIAVAGADHRRPPKMVSPKTKHGVVSRAGKSWKILGEHGVIWYNSIIIYIYIL